MNIDVILQSTEHRPYPMPTGPWIMTQRWSDLLFMHLPIAPEVLRPLIPAQIELDTFDGQAWVGIVPFRVSHASLRGLPPPPLLSHFPEINVRTYVTLRGIPGVYFFSLDAGSPLAVQIARTVFHLPYFSARMHIQEEQGMIHFQSQRNGISKGRERTKGSEGLKETKGTREHIPAYDALYGPNGPIFFAPRGSLEYWLTERYCLYAVREKQWVYRVDIQHGPWPLQLAALKGRYNTMASAQGIPLPDQPPLLHFARQQDVLLWPLRRIL
ncbi:MAG: DUF2071 domain-containing protein [Ktedonobacteraceae bacterium]